MKRAMMLEKRIRPIGRLRSLVLGNILSNFRELNFWMKHGFGGSWQNQPDYVIWSNPAYSVQVFFKGRNIYHKFSVGIVRRHVDVLICGEREAEDEKDNQKRSDNSNYDEKVVKRLVHYIFHRKDEKDTLNTWPRYHFEPRFLYLKWPKRATKQGVWTLRKVGKQCLSWRSRWEALWGGASRAGPGQARHFGVFELSVFEPEKMSAI